MIRRIGTGQHFSEECLEKEANNFRAKATMAGYFNKALSKLIGKEEFRVLFVGLDAAGKTTILYKLKLGFVSMHHCPPRDIEVYH